MAKEEVTAVCWCSFLQVPFHGRWHCMMWETYAVRIGDIDPVPLEIQVCQCY